MSRAQEIRDALRGLLALVSDADVEASFDRLMELAKPPYVVVPVTNWEEVPEDFYFTAVDKDGNRYGYVERPYPWTFSWTADGRCTLIEGNVACTDWRNSLEERP